MPGALSRGVQVPPDQGWVGLTGWSVILRLVVTRTIFGLRGDRLRLCCLVIAVGGWLYSGLVAMLTLLPVGAWIQLAAVCVVPIAALLQARSMLVLWQRRPLSIWTLLDLAPVWLLAGAAAWIVFAFVAATSHPWASSVRRSQCVRRAVRSQAV